MSAVKLLQILSCVTILFCSAQSVDPTSDDFNLKVIELSDGDSNNEISEAELSAMLAVFSVATGPTTNASTDNQVSKRAVADVQDKCYSLEEYMTIGGSSINGAGDSYLATSDLHNIYPVIIEQVMTAACAPAAEEPDSNYTNALKWGIATASYVVLVSLAFVVVFLYGFMKSDKFRVVLQFLIALGIGTMLGGGILHLIPRVLGLEDEEAGGAAGAEEEEDETWLWKLLIVIAGFYLFYLIENTILMFNRINNTNISLHGHDHSHSKPEANGKRVSKVSHGGHDNGAFDDKDEKQRETSFSSGSSDVESMEEKSDEKENRYFWGLTTLGFVIFCGDCVHNIGDGFIVGVGFTDSLSSGIGTFIAILCHKIPHEFGNFGIYMKNGTTKWKAAFLNLIANCFGFIGLYIVIGADLDNEQTSWFVAVVVGMFLYIALVDMFPEMVEERTKWPKAQFFAQNCGLLLGWTIMMLLAVYEEDIEAAVGG